MQICFGILEVLLYYKGATQPNDMLNGEKPVSQMLCYLLKVFRLRDNVFQVLLNQFKVLHIFMIKIYNSLLPWLICWLRAYFEGKVLELANSPLQVQDLNQDVKWNPVLQSHLAKIPGQVCWLNPETLPKDVRWRLCFIYSYVPLWQAARVITIYTQWDLAPRISECHTEEHRIWSYLLFPNKYKNILAKFVYCPQMLICFT